jgi:dissimilatory sulfite reductase (desulfoviridin) alpha/beta subunit
MERGVPENKISVVMNGVDQSLFYPRPVNVELLEKVENSIRAWGIHPCESWDDYNSYVQCLGDDAMETAYYDEEGMTMC